MDPWELWAIVAGIIIFIFAFFTIVTCAYRRSRKEKVISSLIQARYSVHSRFSTRSFHFWGSTAVGGRSSVQSQQQHQTESLNNSGANNKSNRPLEVRPSPETRTSLHPHGGGLTVVNNTGKANTPQQSSRLSTVFSSSSRSSRASNNSFTLDIIKEYEEKESELGLMRSSMSPDAK